MSMKKRKYLQIARKYVVKMHMRMLEKIRLKPHCTLHANTRIAMRVQTTKSKIGVTKFRKSSNATLMPSL
jgi:hypothetical protein